MHSTTYSATEQLAGSLAPDAKRLYSTLIGLASETAIVRGISSNAIAKIAALPDRRDVTRLAGDLVDVGLIRFEPGTFRRAHAFTLVAPVPSAWHERLAPIARRKLNQILRKGSSVSTLQAAA